MNAGAAEDKLRRVYKRRLNVRADSLDNITHALTSPSPSPSPLPKRLVAALEAEGSVFVSSYAGASPLLDALAPHQAQERPKGSGMPAKQEPPQDDETATAASSLFHRFLCGPPPSLRGRADADSAMEVVLEDLVTQPWVRQVVSVLNPPPLPWCTNADSTAAVRGVASKEGRGVSRASSPVLFDVTPITTVTAILDDDRLTAFPPGGATPPSSEEQLWRTHVHRVATAEAHLHMELKRAWRALCHCEAAGVERAGPYWVSVPIYHTAIFAADTATTRIASIGSLTNRVLGLVVRPEGEATNAAVPQTAAAALAPEAVSRLLCVNTTLLRLLILCTHIQAECGQLDDDVARHDLTQVIRRLARTLITCIEEHEADEHRLWRVICRDDADALPSGLDARSTALCRQLSRPTSVLVHCLQGVSRSPSVVLYYILTRYAVVLSTPPAGAARLDDGEETEDEAHPTYAALIDLVRRARPCVKPNFFFSAELSAAWRRLTRA